MKQIIEVVPYNPEWPEMFESEAKLIKEALGTNCISIYHIGSTSVPGLKAKPIIDILPVVKDIQQVDLTTEAMEFIGYEAKGEFGIAFRRYFQKGKSGRTHNIHVYEEGDPEIDRYLKFRNWMRSHENDAKAYSKLKLALAEKFPNDILQYCFGKDAFVASIDAKDGYSGYRMVQALTDIEWATVRALCPEHFLDRHKDHIHFVFYKNSEIIGYSHLQLCPKNRASLLMLAIDKRYRNLGWDSLFLKLLKRWLKHQSYEIDSQGLEMTKNF